VNGDPTLVDGKVGKAYDLDGDGDYLNVGNPEDLLITGSQTICMWLYPHDFSVRRNPFAKAYGGEGTITQEMSGTLSYYYGISGENAHPYQGFGSSQSIPINQWSFVCIVRDLEDMKLK